MTDDTRMTKKQLSLVQHAIKQLAAGATLGTALSEGATEAGYAQTFQGRKAYSNNPAVKEAIDRAVEHYRAEFEGYLPVAEPAMMVDLMKIGLADITLFYKDGQLKPQSEWPDEWTAVIKELVRDKEGTLTDVKLHDKVTAIERFMKVQRPGDGNDDEGNQINIFFQQVDAAFNQHDDARIISPTDADSASTDVVNVSTEAGGPTVGQNVEDEQPLLDPAEGRGSDAFYAELSSGVFGDTPPSTTSSPQEPPARD